MKGTIFNFVKIANSFFFFLGFIFLSLFVAYQLYDANFRDKHTSYDSIQLIDDNNTASNPIEYKKSFIKKFEDVYVFRVRSNRIMNPSLDSGSAIEMYNMFGGSSEYDDFETVNFLFAKEDDAPKLLLESHALVLDYQLITLDADPTSFNRQFKTNKHLFSVVENDDNQDKFLDKKDKVNLLASDYKGENLITIAKDIDGYEIVEDNLLLITQTKEDKTVRLIYNLETSVINTLNTNLPSS